MNRVLVDSNVALDLSTDDLVWADRAEAAPAAWSETCDLCINAVIYAETSVGLSRIEKVEAAGGQAQLHLLPLPLLTRDARRFGRYFRRLRVVSP